MTTSYDRSSPSGPIAGQKTQITLDFGAIAAGTSSALTATVTGARPGDVVAASPAADLEAGIAIAWARVSADDTVKLSLLNGTTGSINPASVVFDIEIRKSI